MAHFVFEYGQFILQHPWLGAIIILVFTPETFLAWTDQNFKLLIFSVSVLFLTILSAFLVSV